MEIMSYVGIYEYLEEVYDFGVLYAIQEQMEQYDERIFVTNNIYAIIIGIKIKDMKMTETMQEVSEIIKNALNKYGQELLKQFKPNYKISYNEFLLS